MTIVCGVILLRSLKGGWVVSFSSIGAKEIFQRGTDER